jgi:tRNA threonylcarbamoyladenosine biosynthesis protein TsaB
MSRALLLETSSTSYSAAVMVDGDLAARHSTNRREPGFDGVPGMAWSVLEAAGLTFADLTAIVVDVGPGNLTSVRSGVAYANALAHARRIAITGVNSLELLAARTDGDGAPGPVLALRKAGGTAVYAGLFEAAAAPRYAVGDLDDVLKKLADQLPKLTLTGSFRAEAAAVLAHVETLDSGSEFPAAADLHTWLRTRGPGPLPDAAHPAGTRPTLVTPLTENSDLFHD